MTTESAKAGTPRTDAAFKLIQISNHEECDIEHHRRFLAEAKEIVTGLELRAEQAEAALAACQKAMNEIREQAEAGVFVQHDCPAMFACAAIVVELDEVAALDMAAQERTG